MCFAILTAAGFLPPDTSRRDIDDRGTIAVCLPESYPPLVTGNPDLPGFDVEFVREIAARAGWRLQVMPRPSMGRELNPRAWHVTRAQCQMLAGGVTLSETTRSFMDTSAGHIVTGWAMLTPDPDQTEPLAGQKVGFHAGLTGLDRIGLARYLRDIGANPVIVPSSEALLQGLADGAFDVAVTEALSGRGGLDSATDLNLVFLPERLGRFTLGLGFWRGDATLRRHVDEIIAEMAADGTLDAIAARYDIPPEALCHTAEAHC